LCNDPSPCRRDIIFELALVLEPQLQGILSERDAPVQLQPYSYFILDTGLRRDDENGFPLPRSLPQGAGS
jgi:hypothetical protein